MNCATHSISYRAGYLVAGLAAFAGVVWTFGWMARGFLGIPRGMDKRPD
jgi:hypothetical protein